MKACQQNLINFSKCANPLIRKDKNPYAAVSVKRKSWTCFIKSFKMIRPKKIILFIPEMQVTNKIFTWAAAKNFFLSI